MGLNLDAINDIAEEIEKTAKGGNSFLGQKELPEEADFRLIEPRPNMGGIFFVKENAIWINNKKYISPTTFGEACGMKAIIDEALAKNDTDLTALVKRMCYQGDLDKLVSIQYHVPMLRMVVDGKGNITDIPEDTPVTLQCTTMLIQRLLKIVSHRNYRGTKDGVEYFITDPKLGHNITLSKKKKGSRTEYDAIAGKQVEIAESFYDIEKLPNPVYNIKKQMYSDAYLKSVINNYLYGDTLLEEEKRFDDKELEEFKVDSAPVEAKKATGKPASKKVADTGENKKEGPKAEAKEAKTETSAPAAGGSIEDDLDDLD